MRPLATVALTLSILLSTGIARAGISVVPAPIPLCPGGMRTVTITNAGGAAISLGSIAVTGPDATHIQLTTPFPPPFALAAGASLQVTLSAVGGPGGLAAQLAIATNDPAQPNVFVPILCGGPDLAVPPDMAIAPDMATVPDLAIAADMGGVKRHGGCQVGGGSSGPAILLVGLFLAVVARRLRRNEGAPGGDK